MSRVCPNCGYDEVPEGTDWCPRCNEFLAWADRGEQATAAERAEAGENGSGTVTATRSAVEAAPAAGRVVLRLIGAGEDTPTDLPVEVRVEAGRTTSLHALVRNESEVVDHFRISVAGLPHGWWSVEDDVVRLLPFGSGEYETELAIAIHPPRTAHSRVGRWEFEVVATAVAQPLEARAEASVDVLPFQALELKARPPVSIGRRRGRFFAEVRNVGNAPVAVDVDASEIEDRCRFVLPPVLTGIVPGETAEIPIIAQPRRPLIIGRKADRLLELRAWTAGDEPGPPASASAIFRQRPWIPWWTLLIVLLLVIAAVLVFLLWPDREKVPDVRGMPSAFAAQKRLEREGLTADPNSKTAVNRKVKPGTVIGQTPAPGTEVDEGEAVTLLLARGRKKAKVPDVTGLTPVKADQRLVKAHLTLGNVAPELDPKGKIASQVPAAGRRRRRGTPVNVVLAGTKVEVPKLKGLKIVKAEKRLEKAGLELGKKNPRPKPQWTITNQVPAPGTHRTAGSTVDVFLKPPPKKKKEKEKAKDEKGNAKKDQGAGEDGGPEAGLGSVPDTSGAAAFAALAAVQAAGLQPRTVLAIDGAAPGTIVRSVPAAGDPAPSDGRVRIVVSAGFPRLAYGTGGNVVTAGGAAGRGIAPVLGRRAAESAPSWTRAGDAVVARSAGALMIASTDRPGRPARLALGRAGADLAEPSIAPSERRTVLAFVSREPETGDRLCFSDLFGRAASAPSCRRLRGWRLGELTWMPNGRTLLAAAGRLDGAGRRFGLLRLRTRVPFSTDAGAWRGGASLVTPVRRGRGVAAAAVAPSGRRVAVVTNLRNGRFQVAIAATDDLALERARLLPLQGCDVAWRPDGKELAVVQSDNACAQPVGRIVRVAPARPRMLQTVVLRGRDPAWQPLELGRVSPARASALGTRP